MLFLYSFTLANSNYGNYSLHQHEGDGIVINVNCNNDDVNSNNNEENNQSKENNSSITKDIKEHFSELLQNIKSKIWQILIFLTLNIVLYWSIFNIVLWSGIIPLEEQKVIENRFGTISNENLKIKKEDKWTRIKKSASNFFTLKIVYIKFKNIINFDTLKGIYSVLIHMEFKYMIRLLILNFLCVIITFLILNKIIFNTFSILSLWNFLFIILLTFFVTYEYGVDLDFLDIIFINIIVIIFGFINYVLSIIIDILIIAIIILLCIYLLLFGLNKKKETDEKLKEIKDKQNK